MRNKNGKTIEKERAEKQDSEEYSAYEEEIEEDEKSRYKIYALALFLAVIVVLMIVPFQYIPLDPEPKRIISLEGAIGKYSLKDLKQNNNTKGSYYLHINASSPIIKNAANKIASYGCGNSRICQAKAIFYFVRDKIDYIGEKDDYVQDDAETLLSGGGDCEDKSILLSSLLNAIGIPTEIITIPRHAFVKAYIKDAPKKYLLKDRWVALDASCEYCKFGEMSRFDKEEYENNNYHIATS